MSHAERLEELRRIIAGLDSEAPPRAVILRRALSGIRDPGRVMVVMSASFNPPTRAHLRMAELAAERCGSGEVLLLLAKVNVEKGFFGAPLEARLLMLEALAESRPGFSVAAVNRARFVDKAEALQFLYPADTDLRFIVGYDTLVRLFDPRFYGDLPAELARMFGSCRFLAANRAEHDPGAVRRLLEGPEVRAFQDRIEVMELDSRHAAMSSSAVRQRLHRGEAVGDLVPEAVEWMIGRLGLYRNPT